MSNQTFFGDSQEEILLRKYTKIPLLLPLFIPPLQLLTSTDALFQISHPK